MCKESYDNSDYKYCPKCSTRLNEDEAYNFVMGWVEHFSKQQRMICKNCGKHFIEEEYNYCPFCSQELEVEKIFTVDIEKRIVTGKWNEDTISADFEGLYREYRIEYFPIALPIFFEIFHAKYEWDGKFEDDLKDTAEKVPKLTFGEVRALMIHLGNMGYYNWHYRNSKRIIGFKTFDSIKKEYGISNFEKIEVSRMLGYYEHFDDCEYILLNNNILISCFEIRKKKLYYLIQYDLSDEIDE